MNWSLEVVISNFENYVTSANFNCLIQYLGPILKWFVRNIILSYYTILNVLKKSSNEIIDIIHFFFTFFLLL